MLFIVCKIRNPVSFYLCSVHNNYGCDSLPTLRILNYNMIICVSEMSRHLSPFPILSGKTWGNFQPVISAFLPPIMPSYSPFMHHAEVPVVQDQ